VDILGHSARDRRCQLPAKPLADGPPALLISRRSMAIINDAEKRGAAMGTDSAAAAPASSGRFTVAGKWPVLVLAAVALLLLATDFGDGSPGILNSAAPAGGGSRRGAGGGSIRTTDFTPPPSCDCTPDSPKFVVVKPCAGLVNQHYAIAHAALLAASLGADVVIDDMSTRASFADANTQYVESARLPADTFQALPATVTTEHFTTTLHARLPRHLAACTFPKDSCYRRHAMLPELAYMTDAHLGPTCGVPSTASSR
jgi:hypothetical protein